MSGSVLTPPERSVGGMRPSALLLMRRSPSTSDLSTDLIIRFARGSPSQTSRYTFLKKVAVSKIASGIWPNWMLSMWCDHLVRTLR